MEKSEEILEKIRENKDSKISEIIKDIILIDGAIVDNDTNYKEKNIFLLEKKYKEKLDKLFYNIVKEDVKEKVKEKVEENVESKNKYYNTKLGTIKVFLIRIAGLETLGENNIFGMIDLSKQYDKEKIYKILEKLDVFLAENI